MASNYCGGEGETTMARSYCGGEGAIILHRVLKIPIDYDPRFDDLLKIWRSSLIIGLHSYVKRYNLNYYHQLRKAFSEYNSQIFAQAYKTAPEMVKACLQLLKVNPRTKYPSAEEVKAIPFTAQHGFIKDGKLHIIYKPRERIITKAYPSERQVRLMAENSVKGGILVKQGDKWFWHQIIEKEVDLDYRPETFIGVDVGMNYLVVATAIANNGKVQRPIFFKGGEWRHLLLEKRAKRRVLDSRGANLNKFCYYNNRIDELLHLAAKAVVEYARQFAKPVIIMEHLVGMRKKGVNKKWNYLMSSWQRRRLQDYIRYKAEWEGIRVEFVKPRMTSRLCSYCDGEGERAGKIFKCNKCHRTLNADFNASVNIAKRWRDSPNDERMTGRGSSGWLKPLDEGLLPTPAQLPSDGAGQDEAGEANGGGGQLREGGG